jgi:hypothetical protein
LLVSREPALNTCEDDPVMRRSGPTERRLIFGGPPLNGWETVIVFVVAVIVRLQTAT